jgi:hypothetical protein
MSCQRATGGSTPYCPGRFTHPKNGIRSSTRAGSFCSAYEYRQRMSPEPISVRSRAIASSAEKPGNGDGEPRAAPGRQAPQVPEASGWISRAHRAEPRYRESGSASKVDSGRPLIVHRRLPRLRCGGSGLGAAFHLGPKALGARGPTTYASIPADTRKDRGFGARHYEEAWTSVEFGLRAPRTCRERSRGACSATRWLARPPRPRHLVRELRERPADPWFTRSHAISRLAGRSRAASARVGVPVVVTVTRLLAPSCYFHDRERRRRALPSLRVRRHASAACRRGAPRGYWAVHTGSCPTCTP